MKEYVLSELELPKRYGLLTRVVAPRPIAFVSSLSADGQGNLSPFSYFTVGGANPASCVIAPVNRRDGSSKDTLANIRATGEYTIAVVTEAMAPAASQTSYEYPPEVDEFDAVGFTRLPGVQVRTPGVAESPVNLECRLHTIVDHGAGPLAGHYVIGEILLARVDEAVLTDGWPDNRKLQQVGRCGELLYSRAYGDSLFEIPRPTQP